MTRQEARRYNRSSMHELSSSLVRMKESQGLTKEDGLKFGLTEESMRAVEWTLLTATTNDYLKYAEWVGAFMHLDASSSRPEEEVLRPAPTEEMKAVTEEFALS